MGVQSCPRLVVSFAFPFATFASFFFLFITLVGSLPPFASFDNWLCFGTHAFAAGLPFDVSFAFLGF